MSYGKFYSPAKAESDQKDIIIAQLKADIFEQRKNEEDYYILSDELRKIEMKIKLTSEERLLQEAEFRARHEQAMKQVQQLRAEVDSLQAALAQKLRETEQFKDDNLRLSELCDLRQLDIQNCKRDFGKTKDDLMLENQHLDRLQEQQALLEDEIKNNQFRNSDLQKGIDDLKKRLAEKERVLARMEDELKQFSEKAGRLAQDNSEAQNEISAVNGELKQADGFNLDTIKQIRQMEAHLSKLEEEANYVQNDAGRSAKTLQQEQTRNNELNNRAQQLENVNRQKEAQLSDLAKEYDLVSQENQNIVGSNAQMKDDWDALQRHIEVLLNSNSEVVWEDNRNNFYQILMELEKYCDDDDRVRQLINRRARVKELSLRVQSGMRVKPQQQQQQQQPLSSFKSSPMKSTQLGASSSYSGQKKKFQGSKYY